MLFVTAAPVSVKQVNAACATDSTEAPEMASKFKGAFYPMLALVLVLPIIAAGITAYVMHNNKVISPSAGFELLALYIFHCPVAIAI